MITIRGNFPESSHSRIFDIADRTTLTQPEVDLLRP